MKYSGYFLLPLMIFSSDYVAAGVLNGTADNGTACSSSSPMMAAMKSKSWLCATELECIFVMFMASTSVLNFMMAVDSSNLEVA